MQHHVEVSQLVCRWLPRVLAFELQTHATLVADGAWLLPAFAAGLSVDGIEIRTAFIHEPDVAGVQAAMESRRNRAVVAPWHARSDHVSWSYGNYLAGEAHRLGTPVVAARPRESLVSRLRAALGSPGPERR